MRWYVRCRDCLAVRATEGAPPRLLQCECGGSLEVMGEVRATRLVQIELGPPCDGRCTSARGPKCDCTCRGANHGSGLVVEIIREVGRPPRLRGADLATAVGLRSA